MPNSRVEEREQGNRSVRQGIAYLARRWESSGRINPAWLLDLEDANILSYLKIL